jgi:hypothetical protein
MFDKVNMTITRGGARPATVTGRGLAAGGGVGALSTESLFYFFVFPKLYFFPLPPVSMFKCFSDRSEVCWLALPSTNAYERVCVYNKTSMFILVVVLQSLFDRTNKTRERERERIIEACACACLVLWPTSIQVRVRSKKWERDKRLQSLDVFYGDSPSTFYFVRTDCACNFVCAREVERKREWERERAT